MTEQISPEAVEAATRAFVYHTSSGICTENWPKPCDMCDCFATEMPDPWKRERYAARAVLSAALPHLRAEIERQVREQVAAEIERHASEIRDRTLYYGADLGPTLYRQLMHEIDGMQLAARITRGQEASRD